MWTGVSITRNGGPATEAAVATFAEEHGAPLPAALAELYLSTGVGTFGDFVYFEAPDGMMTHREIIEDIMDEDSEEDLAPTADVIVFARTSNRDMAGWHAADLRAGNDRVVRLDGFDEEPLADSTREFLEGLPTKNYFGFGVLPATYVCHKWDWS